MHDCTINVLCWQHCQHCNLFWQNIAHFLHNYKMNKDCTNVLFIYCTTLRKVLHSIIDVFIAQSIVLYCTKYWSVLHKVLFIILHNCIVCKCDLVYCTFLILFCTYLFRFIAHWIRCAKLFDFIAYICCVYRTVLHCTVRSWAKISFLHGLCKNSFITACPAWLPLLVDICHFLSSLLCIPGLHDGSCQTRYSSSSCWFSCCCILTTGSARSATDTE